MKILVAIKETWRLSQFIHLIWVTKSLPLDHHVKSVWWKRPFCLCRVPQPSLLLYPWWWWFIISCMSSYGDMLLEWLDWYITRPSWFDETLRSNRVLLCDSNFKLSSVQAVHWRAARSLQLLDISNTKEKTKCSVIHCIGYNVFDSLVLYSDTQYMHIFVVESTV